jgi:acyl carrier protein
VTDDANFARFRKCAAQVLATPEDRITLEANLREDFGADSLDLVDLVNALEKEFDIDVAEDALANVDTVGQAFSLVQSQL